MYRICHIYYIQYNNKKEKSDPWESNMNWEFTKHDSRKIIEQMLRRSASLIIREMHI